MSRQACGQGSRDTPAHRRPPLDDIPVPAASCVLTGACVLSDMLSKVAVLRDATTDRQA